MSAIVQQAGADRSLRRRKCCEAVAVSAMLPTFSLSVKHCVCLMAKDLSWRFQEQRLPESGCHGICLKK
jgi:hypothetical protein